MSGDPNISKAEALEHFQMEGGIAVFRPVGHFALPSAVRLVTSAIACARELQVRSLMVVTTGVTGFDPPSIATRYFFMRDWALAAGGQVRVAMVCLPEMIDEHKFGITVAANHGLACDVVESEAEALAWLTQGR